MKQWQVLFCQGFQGGYVDQVEVAITAADEYLQQVKVMIIVGLPAIIQQLVVGSILQLIHALVHHALQPAIAVVLGFGQGDAEGGLVTGMIG